MAAISRTSKQIISPGLVKSPGFMLFFLAFYTGTLFLSACLLFSVQPLFGKLLLPQLGGSPSVWNSCMVFYQAVLFAGYVYAHVVATSFGVRRQIMVHSAVFLLSLAVLPVGLSAGLDFDGTVPPALWVLIALSSGIGLPFFVVSTSAPLLQRWFSYSGHRYSDDPYFLYGASNIGSFIALLGYPVFIEPYFGLGVQTSLWSYGYGLLFLCVVACGGFLYALRNTGFAAKSANEPEGNVSGVFAHIFSRTSEIAVAVRFRWLLLSFCPSALMLAVTTYLTTDIASAPFLWVLPLCLYLLSFVIVFARGYHKIHKYMLRAQLVLFFPLAGFYAIGYTVSLPILVLTLVLFFLSCMVCHGELAKLRPPAKYLTSFYLVMSLGGALGGQFSALLAPVLFDWVAEYPLLLLMTIALRPGRVLMGSTVRQIWRDYAYPLAVFLAGACVVALLKEHDFLHNMMFVSALFVAMGLCSVLQARPLRMALFLTAIMFVGFIVSGRVTLAGFATGELLRERNFFGVHYVRKKKQSNNRNYRILLHGTTLHGAQEWRNNTGILEPLTYYHKNGPLGSVFKAYDEANKNWSVGIVGLGTGTTTCYAKPAQDWTYFEIDHDIARLASGPSSMFSYVDNCKPQIRGVFGDARISLQDEPDNRFDFLALDAFSSDAIPVHLLTKEAIALYFAKLKDNGILAVHISNRNLNLQPVVANLADALGLAGYYMFEKAEDTRGYLATSHWVVMAKQRKTLEPLLQTSRWRPLVPFATYGVWTDDFSNLFRIIKWK